MEVTLVMFIGFVLDISNSLLICFGQIYTEIASLTFPRSYTTDYNILACSMSKDTTTQAHETGNGYAYTKNLTGITKLRRSVFTDARYTSGNWFHTAWLAIGY